MLNFDFGGKLCRTIYTLNLIPDHKLPMLVSRTVLNFKEVQVSRSSVEYLPDDMAGGYHHAVLMRVPDARTVSFGDKTIK